MGNGANGGRRMRSPRGASSIAKPQHRRGMARERHREKSMEGTVGWMDPGASVGRVGLDVRGPGILFSCPSVRPRRRTRNRELKQREEEQRRAHPARAFPHRSHITT